MNITLCGSAKFEKEIQLWNEYLTLSGHVVYSLAVMPSHKEGVKNWYTDEEKTILDDIHLQKINNSCAIVVVNMNGYVGNSTKKEIGHAYYYNKGIYFTQSAVILESKDAYSLLTSDYNLKLANEILKLQESPSVVKYNWKDIILNAPR